MNKLLTAGAALLALSASAAFAQTTTSQTTTTVTPSVIAPVIAPLVAPATGTMSSTRTEKTVAPDGSQTDTTATTYRNSNGVADDSVTKTITYPPVISTTTSTSTTTTTKP